MKIKQIAEEFNVSVETVKLWRYMGILRDEEDLEVLRKERDLIQMTVSVKEYSMFTGIPERTVREWCRKRRLPAVRTRYGWRIRYK